MRITRFTNLVVFENPSRERLVGDRHGRAPYVHIPRNAAHDCGFWCEQSSDQCAPPLNVRLMERLGGPFTWDSTVDDLESLAMIGILRLGTFPMLLHSLPKYAQCASRQ